MSLFLFINANDSTAYLVSVFCSSKWNSAILVRKAILSHSCIKACIGFALQPAEPLNGFLRALFEIQLTSQQGLDFSF